MLWVVRGDGRRSCGILAGRFRRSIDPHGRWQRFWTWWPLHEPLGMGGVRGQARAVPDREDRRGAAVVHGGWCQIAQAAVMVRVVVPREQIAADVARVCERAEPARKLRPVLYGPELRFGERIVVAHAGPRMTGVDAQIREEQRDELTAHGGPAVRVNREVVRDDTLLQAGRRNEALRQVSILVARDHPAHGVAAEEVEDDVQRVVEVRDRALELGDVPGPDLIRARRHELGSRIRRMPSLGAPLAHFAGRREHAIHRARGTEVGLLLEQRGMDFGGRLVDEALAVQHVEHRLAFGRTQRARRRRTGPPGCGGRRGAPPAIQRRPGHADALTQRRRLARRGDGLDGTHQSVSSSSRGVRGIPRISATFFWSVMIVSARCSFRWSRRFSASSCFTRGSTGRGVGPRRRPRISRRAPAHLPQGARLALPPPVRQQRRVQPLAPQQSAHLAGLLAGVSLLENAEPIFCGEAPPLDRRRHLRVRVGRAGRGHGAGASRRPPGSLRPRPRDHVHLHDFWHASHLSNPPRPYTNLTREVVSQIIGTGGNGIEPGTCEQEWAEKAKALIADNPELALPENQAQLRGAARTWDNEIKVELDEEDVAAAMQCLTGRRGGKTERGF